MNLPDWIDDAATLGTPAPEHHDVLRRIKGKPKLRQFATIDIETRNWVEPYAVGFYDGRKYVDFLDYTYSWQAIDNALDHVLSPAYSGYWIYAHNGGNFDFTFFLRRLMFSPKLRRRFTVSVTPIGSCIVRFDVEERTEGLHRAECVDPLCRGCDASARAPDDRSKRMKWTFVDSARLMPLPLNEVGEAFGIGKKVQIDISYDELAKPENTKSMRRYLEVDCVLLHKAITKMQFTLNTLGGQIGITLPSSALDLYRRKYQAEDIAASRHSITCPMRAKKRTKGIPPEGECRGCLHKIIRASYCGGRTEIFRMKFQPYTSNAKQIDTGDMLDISSHYPACMLEPMPTGDAIELMNLDEKAILSNAKNLVGFVECDVHIPDDCYLPPLPLKTQEGKLIFPTGNLSGTWNTSELKLLSRVGGKIVRSRQSLWYETTACFARFVRQLYKLRDKKSPTWNVGLDWIAKILMNSLYGKFAMVEERSRIVIHPDSPDGLACVDLEADIWTEECYVSADYVIPQLSAHVTALARARLWELLQHVLDKGGRIYYTDTDSEAISGVRIETGDGLGDLKHEGSFTRAEFTLPKLYLIEWTEKQKKSKKTKEEKVTIKAKGLGPGIRLGEQGDDPLGGELSEAELFDMIRNGVPIERHRISKLREGLNAYAREKLLFPSIVTTPKKMRTTYDKRRVIDGCDTVPLRVNCW
jgi:hypothetical protein